MAIEWDGPTGCFLLTGGGFSYAFAVDRAGTPLRHLHWGGPIGPDDLAAIADPATRLGSNTWSRPRAHTEELVVHGGTRFDECVLKVEFRDGVRALDLAYQGADATGDRLAVRLRDRHRPLAVTLYYEVRGSALCRWLEVTNAGEEPLVLDRAGSAGWVLPWQERPRVTTLSGGYAAESRVTRGDLVPGRLVLESRRGIPGHAHQPWLAVDGGAGEEHGEVWSIAVAHSGSWKLVAELSGDGRVHVVAGLNDFDLRHELAPGARAVLPETVGVYAPDGYDELTARWHRYEREHVLPRPDELRPVLYNSWEATFFDVRHDDQVDLARQAAGLGVELFVVDDGWFVGRTGEGAGLGDWSADPAKLPDGLARLSAAVREQGMRFGVWVEPESVSPASELFRNHPDWIYRWPDREPHRIRESYGLDFGLPAVREWAVETLDHLVREAGVDFLKWDLNRSLVDQGSRGEGTVWLDHVAGFHEVVDRLREAHPGLWLETCASGGGRADLASLARFELAWPSDNTDALERLDIQEGYAFVHSPQTMSCWVTDSPGHLTRRSVPLRFRFHVAMTGMLGVGGNLTAWSPRERAEAAGYVAQYKEIRETVQLGRLHRLGSPRHGERFALCYVAADGAQVAIFVFARAVRQNTQDRPVRLRGLDEAAGYEDPATGRRYSGAFLRYHGLPVALAGDHASELIVLRRTDHRPR
ncbi:alpha-galactosidase [Plantactinospora sp. WMMB334]|uniref:alpha-galactosidase n=1 Tax=Plantactinospora sp. WMMB334 TaxID=3404119 RepID=UPI003B94526A